MRLATAAVLMLCSSACGFSSHGIALRASRVRLSAAMIATAEPLSPEAVASGAPAAAVPLSEAVASGATEKEPPSTIFTLTERSDGWNDVRKGIKDRKNALNELARVCAPAINLVRRTKVWTVVLTQEAVSSANRVTMRMRRAPRRYQEPYPLETHWTSTMAEEAAAASAAAAEEEAERSQRPAERVPILANTVFTLEDRADGWSDVRGLLRRGLAQMREAQQLALRTVATVVAITSTASGLLFAIAALPPLISAFGVARAVSWASELQAQMEAEKERARAEAAAKREQIAGLQEEVEALEQVAAGKPKLAF